MFGDVANCRALHQMQPRFVVSLLFRRLSVDKTVKDSLKTGHNDPTTFLVRLECHAIELRFKTYHERFLKYPPNASRDRILHNGSNTQIWDSSVPEQTATQKTVFCSQSAGEIWNWQKNDQSDLEARKSFSWRGALLLDCHQGTTRKGKWEKMCKSRMQWNLLFWTPPYSEHLFILNTFIKTKFYPIDFNALDTSFLWTLWTLPILNSEHFSETTLLFLYKQYLLLWTMNTGQDYGHAQELWWHHMQ